MSPVTPPTFFVANFPKYNVNINVTINEINKGFRSNIDRKIKGDRRIKASIIAIIIVEVVVYFAKALPIPSGLAYGKLPIIKTIINRPITGAEYTAAINVNTGNFANSDNVANSKIESITKLTTPNAPTRLSFIISNIRSRSLPLKIPSIVSMKPSQ